MGLGCVVLLVDTCHDALMYRDRGAAVYESRLGQGSTRSLLHNNLSLSLFEGYCGTLLCFSCSHAGYLASALDWLTISGSRSGTAIGPQKCHRVIDH